MGKVIDLRKYREKSRGNRGSARRPLDGVYVETLPPFVFYRHYQAGVRCREWRFLSEYLLREILDNQY
jgi:hypothetical protein